MSGMRFISPLPSRTGDPSLVNPRTTEDWKRALKEIKRLYINCHYKKCTAMCEQLLNSLDTRIHPLHEAFLLFFVAICHESMGLAAHDLSSKKLPYLEKAKSAFSAAEIAILRASYSESLVEKDSTKSLVPSLLGSDTYELDYVSERPATPTNSATLTSPFEVHDVGGTLDGRTLNSESIENDALAPIRSTTSSIRTYNKQLLNQRTSDGDIDLMPKPLVIRKRTSPSKIPRPVRPLPPLPTEKSLPALPQTSITPDPNIKNTAPPRLQPVVPWTKPINDLDSLQTYLTQRSITRYNKLLQSFAPQIQSHILFVTEVIATTTFVRAEHQVQKANKNRLASFWCLGTIRHSKPTESAIHSQTDSSDIKTTHPTMVAPGESNPHTSISDVEDNEQRLNRIERLRSMDWHVRKESRGWKGAEYYETIRKRAEDELQESHGRILF